MSEDVAAHYDRPLSHNPRPLRLDDRIRRHLHPAMSMVLPLDLGKRILPLAL